MTFTSTTSIPLATVATTHTAHGVVALGPIVIAAVVAVTVIIRLVGVGRRRRRY